MKTFNQFQQDLQEAIPALAPLVPYVLPAAAAALGAAGMVYQARKKQPPQPSDYGQGGETAKPRTPNVQRGRLDPNEVYKRRRQELNRQDAQARAREKAERGIDDLIGSDEARREAARARANQPQIQQQLRRADQRRRMGQAVQNIPPEHRAD